MRRAIQFILACLAATTTCAIPESLSWANPEFQAKFLGSYGFDGSREPSVSTAEQQVLQSILPLMESGQYTQAARQLRESITPDTSAAIDYTLANLYRQTGENTLAENAYRQALKKSPGFVRASRNLGLLLSQEGRYAEAQVPLAQALERGDSSPSTLGALAFCHYQEGDYATALQGYQQAAFLNAQNADWQLGRAQCLIQLDRAVEAQVVTERHLKIHPEHVEARRVAVNACIAQMDWENAAAHLELLRRMEQADASVLLLLGRAYLALNLPSRAAEVLLDALQLEERPSIEQLLAAAEQLALQGNVAETESLLAVVYQKYGEALSGQALNQLLRLQGRLKMMSDEPAAAARLLQQASARDPLDGRALLLLGSAELELDHPIEAQIAWERATGMDDTAIAADAWLELARLHVGQQHWNAAVEALRNAQSIRPEDRVARYLESVQQVATRAP